MKKVLLYCFERWWLPILILLLVAILTFVNWGLEMKLLEKILMALSIFSLLILLGSAVYQLYHTRLIRACLTVFAALVYVVLSGVFSVMAVLIDGDHFADDLKIPANIQIDNPIGTYSNMKPDSFTRLKKTQTDLVLYNSWQPGIYEYDFWTGKIENGSIYLKAYEITHGTQLSEVSLQESSEIPISNSTDSIVRFRSKKYFQIYEGDWGKYYAARFEVWFRPKSGKKERKLFQKNFKIEGWMH